MMESVVHYPFSSAIFNEARIYAYDSIGHTLDYQGWGDQHRKMERITHGKFGQLWVTEFLRLNGIPFEKDTSSPEVPDDYDLIAFGYRIDVKTSIKRDLVGQVNAAVVDKTDFFCFVLTDALCSYVAPYGFISRDDYLEAAILVKQGEMIPGTALRQRFPKSYFLPPDAKLMPFVQFVRQQGKAKPRVIRPTTIVEGQSIEELSTRIASMERLQIETIKALSSSRSSTKKGNVVPMPVTNDMFVNIAS